MGLFNLLNFLILFWILKKFFFASVVKTINTRQEKIKESVDNIQKARTELQMAEKKAQNLVDEAKVEANKIAAKATEDGKEMAEEMKGKATAEIEKLVTQAKRNMEVDRQAMEATLKSNTAELVIAAVEKVVGEKMDAKKDEAYVQDVVKSLS